MMYPVSMAASPTPPNTRQVSHAPSQPRPQTPSKLCKSNSDNPDKTLDFSTFLRQILLLKYKI